MRIDQMENVTLMPHTAVKTLSADKATVEKEGEPLSLEAFQTIILCSGMLSMPGPGEELDKHVGTTEVIGDAAQVLDIYTAIHAGYDLAVKY
jgi:hypothetical protein